jgi:hypothetical protein
MPKPRTKKTATPASPPAAPSPVVSPKLLRSRAERAAYREGFESGVDSVLSLAGAFFGHLLQAALGPSPTAAPLPPATTSKKDPLR